MSDDQAPVNTEENIIQAVLAQAFSPPPSRRQSLQPGLSNLEQPPVEEGSPIPRQLSESSDKNPAPSTSSETATNDAWKAEYEAQVEAWRAQSAEAREKAERERERWEALRAAERKEGKKAELDLPAGPLPPATPAQEEHETGWETVSSSHQSTSGSTVIVSAAPSSPKLSESRHEATTETADHVLSNPGITAYPPTDVPEPDSHHDTGDESQKWEDLHSSVTSSFPSMSFPERTETPSPSRQNKLSAQPPPTSATLAVFDSSLSTRTRAKALLTSLAINMLLPFINGVMLGFGEIFAKNVIMGWFGWKVPGATIATTTGIGVKTPWNQKQKKQ